MESYYQPVVKSPNITSKKTSPRIAIQGVHGAFHEIAARYFHTEGGLEIVPADTFDILFQFRK